MVLYPLNKEGLWQNKLINGLENRETSETMEKKDAAMDKSSRLIDVQGYKQESYKERTE